MNLDHIIFVKYTAILQSTHGTVLLLSKAIKPVNFLYKITNRILIIPLNSTVLLKIL